MCMDKASFYDVIIGTKFGLRVAYDAASTVNATVSSDIQ